jgi:hypothetical protein
MCPTNILGKYEPIRTMGTKLDSNSGYMDLKSAGLRSLTKLFIRKGLKQRKFSLELELHSLVFFKIGKHNFRISKISAKTIINIHNHVLYQRTKSEAK